MIYFVVLKYLKMNLTDFWWGVGDLLEGMTSMVFDNIGNFVNDGLLLLGFVGLFIWLAKQKKFNAEAEANPDQLK